ncbi:CGNR zinc finger domain-containing protein [Pseudoxanthomonas sp.]|jgi:predicted RNA-binding Zn ribbon-like protein|uniref:CGNR zinc finger domain-containing protein n=1 Tax=Pseudoxanthomonas sp. TaxID=1871049 RepID=UPI002E1217E6|nr:ABATE domain-containing protein [Pseudoxanthomonas sp.]
MDAVAPRVGTGGRPDAPQVGDHLALDLLNTEALSQGQAIDHWESGEDVHRWLVRQGIASAGEHTPSDLLQRGRDLRKAVREAIAARKAGEPFDVQPLNVHLEAYLTAPRLQRDAAGGWAMTRLPANGTAASLLGPVAEAAAHLLVEGDFALVRQCEHPDCILWFYDRTKSHKRRWCSMAQCGNRQKAARFRKRNHAE